MEPREPSSELSTSNQWAHGVAPPDDISRILNGEEFVQSHPLTSQYRVGGVSSSILAALNCARVVFRNGRAGRPNLLRSLLSQADTAHVRKSADSYVNYWLY